MDYSLRGDMVFLRPKESLRWVIPGYPNPRENMRCVQCAGNRYYFFEDLAAIAPDKPIYVLAYNDVDIMRAGNKFWDLMRKNRAFVDVGKSKYLTTLVNALYPDFPEIPKPESWVNDAANYVETLPHENYKVLVAPTKDAVDRAKFIYNHLVLFKPKVVQDGLWNIETTYGRKADKGMFIGNFEDFGKFLDNLPETSVGLKKIEAYVNVNVGKLEVEFAAEKFMSIMENVKDSLKLEFYFNCDTFHVDVLSLLKFKLKGVHPVVPDTFKKKVRDKIIEAVKQKRLVNDDPIETVRGFYE